MIHEVMQNAAVIYQHGTRSFAVDSKEEEEEAALKIIKSSDERLILLR